MSELSPFKIRDIEINPPLVLSPMAGVTDISFRRLLKQRGGVGLNVFVFISVEGLTRNHPKLKRPIRIFDNDRKFDVQIFRGLAGLVLLHAELSHDLGADMLAVYL